MASEGDMTWQIKVCRAEGGSCRFALSELAEVLKWTEKVLETSGWPDFLRSRTGGSILHHHRLAVVLAGCPNACTRPQIEDVGIIANLTPTEINGECTGCGRCVRACREDAILLETERARLRPAACVGCGSCARACTREAIMMRGLKFRFLVGGRVGRHPRWASEIFSQLPPGRVAPVLEEFVGLAIRHLAPGEGIGDMVERLGARSVADLLGTWDL